MDMQRPAATLKVDALAEHDDVFRSVFEQAPIGTAIVAMNGRCLRVNRALTELLGYDENELLTTSLGALAHSSDAEATDGAVRRLVAGAGDSCRLEQRFVDKYGNTVWALLSLSLVRNGEPQYLIAQFQDSTAHTEAEAAIRKSEERLRLALQVAKIGVWEWDLRSGQLAGSYKVAADSRPACTFELSYDDFVGAVHPDDREAIATRLRRAVAEGADFEAEFRMGRAGEDVRWTEAKGQAVCDASGQPLRMLGVWTDVTKRKWAEEQLTHRAVHDPLTGLPNRTLFLDRLAHALARASRRRTTVAILFLDLDDFKVVNDTFGHEAGDRLLVLVARRLQDGLRPEDTLARYGGDEFTILVEDVADADGAFRVADRALARLRQPFAVGDRELLVTAAVGITLGGSHRDQPADLLCDADAAMYAAKRRGRGRYALFVPGMNASSQDRLELEADLRLALERKEIEVYYQPIVDLSTGRIPEVEALMRWQHPRRGLIEPDAFLPLAEETGLIVPLGNWVIEEACRHILTWPAPHPDDLPVTLSVNLSPRQFRQPSLVADVARVLEETLLTPSRLKLEISERVAMDDEEGAVATLRALKGLGVQLAVDDFGAGYSTLSYLRRAPVDGLKIDRSFVGGLGLDPDGTTIVRAVVSFAKALDLSVTAEGVETAEQLAALRAMGCDWGQGYYFARPLPGAVSGTLSPEVEHAPIDCFDDASVHVAPL